MLSCSSWIANGSAGNFACGRLGVDAAVSQFSHTVGFSDYPQVHSGPGDAINNDNVRIFRVDKNIALTA
jgi:hypothetical protein